MRSAVVSAVFRSASLISILVTPCGSANNVRAVVRATKTLLSSIRPLPVSKVPLSVSTAETPPEDCSRSVGLIRFC